MVVHQCKWCEYSTTRKANLTRHIRKHTGERPFACNICPYRAADESSIVAHVRIHTGEKPFACTICDYKAAQAAHLRTHLRTHTGERPYACKQCAYRAATDSALTVHMKVHSNERPYECDICGLRTKTRGRLTEHKKTHARKNKISMEAAPQVAVLPPPPQVVTGPSSAPQPPTSQAACLPPLTVTPSLSLASSMIMPPTVQLPALSSLQLQSVTVPPVHQVQVTGTVAASTGNVGGMMLSGTLQEQAAPTVAMLRGGRDSISPTRVSPRGHSGPKSPSTAKSPGKGNAGWYF
mmetsp:Transcript_8406/g.21444  ORF Transcript_8406/g.21444 Transcript_8406/m.21444 type:complete len:293 (-) Transcript_8406:196-1074(-)|eukprot:CAMPEP_0182925384 /NCGR_PEP_ID=MMETSP0105_2-20130417/9384_1 /TAXON_ID=81532 ORGANISM="Acanthoeca-like sp., Strain 10tr" /NCGR_SAMPLE_ID=MMETSP0105_2 /ASSEMBLY_ACC=CAM_ASM_000205 /LENGTH=292 /DNA_ID=CAMNT_0025063233 /DNA_START=345 /DNA_END=1223 /DNA_ORIENTATION=-